MRRLYALGALAGAAALVLTGCADGAGADLNEEQEQPVVVEETQPPEPEFVPDETTYLNAMHSAVTLFSSPDIATPDDQQMLAFGYSTCQRAARGESVAAEQQALIDAQNDAGLFLFTIIGASATFNLCPDERGWFDDQYMLANPAVFRSTAAAFLEERGVSVGPDELTMGGDGYEVTCVDGTVSYSGGIQGACSYHGGVAG